MKKIGRIGSLVYATDQGLGLLAKSFYDHGVVTNVLVVRHAHHPTHLEWYPKRFGEVPVRRILQPVEKNLVHTFCATMDAMLFFETPFDWGLIDYCRSCGVKTVLMPMHECMPDPLPAHPDLFLCPSLLNLDCYPDKRFHHQESVAVDGSHEVYSRSVFLPVPVEVPWRLRTEARVFVHNAGHGGLRGRNGTAELLAAMELLRSPIKLILRSQASLDPVADSRVDLRIGTSPHDALYNEGDVFVFPEKFNGLSLPLQEARAAGMLVMGTDRFPMNTWLPKEPLITVYDYRRSRISGRCLEFDEAQVTPLKIAQTIEAWYGRDIADYSRSGKAWAESNSWEVLKPKYLEVLHDLVG